MRSRRLRAASDGRRMRSIARVSAGPRAASRSSSPWRGPAGRSRSGRRRLFSRRWRGLASRPPASAGGGACGVCLLPVVEGLPDHRDHVLSDAEKSEGRLIATCVSRARSETLVLDFLRLVDDEEKPIAFVDATARRRASA